MARNTQELAERIGTSQEATTTEWTVQFRAAWKQNGQNIIRFAGGMEQAKKLYAALTYAIQTNPRLMQASVDSLLSAALQCAATNLYPGPYQEAALLPFAGKVTFVPQYQGLAKLLYQSGFVKKIAARVVWSGDDFDYSVGSDEKIRHKPEWDESKRGHRIGVYCIITNIYGAEEITYLTAAQVERVKASAPGAKMSDSPWNSKDPDRVDAMWKKTAIRRAAKLLPKTPQLSEALEADADEPSPPKAPIIEPEMPKIEPTSTPSATSTDESIVPPRQSAGGAEDLLGVNI